jgi:hypothetical protein
MFDKEDIANVKKLNAFLGTDHRSRPYDLNKAEDLEQALLLTVAVYRDYRQYGTTLDLLIEDYDETLEHDDPASWINLGLAPEKVDDLSYDGLDALESASRIFNKIIERAKAKCALIIKAILSTPPATQQAVLGKEYRIKLEEMDEMIEGLFNDLDEAEYHYPMKDNRDALLEIMKESWAAF